MRHGLPGLGLAVMLLVGGCTWGSPWETPVSIRQDRPRPPSHPLLIPNLFLKSQPATATMAAPPPATTPVTALGTVPRSGRWRFVPRHDSLELSPFVAQLDIGQDGTIVITGLDPRLATPDVPMPESYLKRSGQDMTLAYLMLDRLYRMAVVSPTRMRGEAWYGIRPPQVAPFDAEWLGTNP